MTPLTDSDSVLRSVGATRLAALCGLLWPILAVTRLPLTGEPDLPGWTETPEAIVAFYRDSSFDGQFVAGVGLVTLGYMLLLVFVSKLSVLIGEDRNGAPWLGRSVLAFAIVSVIASVGYLMAFATAVFWSSHGGLGDDGYLVLHGLSFAAYWAVLPADLMLGLTLGGAILLTRMFPRWLGWAMILTGVAEGVSWFASPDAWNATSGLPYVWFLIAAIIVLRKPEEYVSR
ncbi:MAG: hypothetical protein R3249_00555 [Nitriliruptorales bacterium]|nr:hypothetical protein [Nitriliruptorales bacterium]